jgi:hypothetical protein
LIPGRRGDEEQPKATREFLANQRAEKSKREHDELVQSGEEVVSLTEELDEAFSRNNRLSEAELAKLESLEKLVSKIRKNLGGNDNDSDDERKVTPAEERPPNSVEEAFSKLKDVSAKLVDELKRSSRFTVSVMAIQSSNSVLKIVRFLRFRK